MLLSWRKCGWRSVKGARGAGTPLGPLGHVLCTCDRCAACAQGRRSLVGGHHGTWAIESTCAVCHMSCSPTPKTPNRPNRAAAMLPARCSGTRSNCSEFQKAGTKWQVKTSQPRKSRSHSAGVAWRHKLSSKGRNIQHYIWYMGQVVSHGVEKRLKIGCSAQTVKRTWMITTAVACRQGQTGPQCGFRFYFYLLKCIMHRSSQNATKMQYEIFWDSACCDCIGG